MEISYHTIHTLGASSLIIVSNLVMNSEYLPKNLYLLPSSTKIKCVWSPFRGTLSLVVLLYYDTFKSVIFESVKVKSLKIKRLPKSVKMIQKIISKKIWKWHFLLCSAVKYHKMPRWYNARPVIMRPVVQIPDGANNILSYISDNIIPVRNMAQPAGFRWRHQ